MSVSCLTASQCRDPVQGCGKAVERYGEGDVLAGVAGFADDLERGSSAQIVDSRRIKG